MKGYMFQILFTFYRRFILVTGSISLIFCFFFWPAKSLSFGFTLFWMKIIINFLIGFLFITFGKEATIFYNNLGYSSSKLYGGIMALDILIWLSMITIISLIR